MAASFIGWLTDLCIVITVVKWVYNKSNTNAYIIDV